MAGRGGFVVFVAVCLAVAALYVYAGEVARGELAIVGLGLEVQREPVVTAVDVPLYVQTNFDQIPPHLAPPALPLPEGSEWPVRHGGQERRWRNGCRFV